MSGLHGSDGNWAARFATTTGERPYLVFRHAAVDGDDEKNGDESENEGTL